MSSLLAGSLNQSRASDEVEFPALLPVNDKFTVLTHEDFTHNYNSLIDIVKAKKADGASFFISHPARQVVQMEALEKYQLFYQALLDSGYGCNDFIVRAPLFLQLSTAVQITYKQSAERFIQDCRATRLCGLKYIVTHLGSGLLVETKQNQQQYKYQMMKAINYVLENIPDLNILILYQSDYKQGRRLILNSDFQYIKEIFETCSDPSRMGLCLDVQQAFIGGLGTQENFGKQLFQEVDSKIGRQLVKFIYFSDTKSEYNQRSGCNECLGKGNIGLDQLRKIVRKFSKHSSFVLRTPNQTEHTNEINLIKQWQSDKE